MNNPPAFPIVIPGHVYGDGSSEPPGIQEHGMSLRDWFAGMALQGLVLSFESSGVDVVAKSAYQYADAMLAERENPAKKEEL